MYNKAILMGRICNDLEIKTTPSGVNVLSFSVAVDRRYQEKGQEKKSDFFNCVAWRNDADFISRFFRKGAMILIEGELQNRKYTDKNGIERQVTELIVERVNFTGEKSQQSGAHEPPPMPEEPPQYKNKSSEEKQPEGKQAEQMTAESFANAADEDYPF